MSPPVITYNFKSLHPTVHKKVPVTPSTKDDVIGRKTNICRHMRVSTSFNRAGCDYFCRKIF